MIYVENETLKELDLSWNHIRSHGAVGIALGLKKNIALLKLSLAWNGFGFEGSAALACALATNTTLTHLDLACNRIHPPALFELIKGLATNKTLRVLCLSHNPITAPMTSILLDRIKNFKQTHLVELDLKGVVVDKFFAEILQEIREKRPMFTVYYDMALPVNKAPAKTYDPTNIFNIDPIRILYFMKEHMRTIDLFLKLDKDGSNSLTRDEMLYAFEREGYPISEDALDTVMGYLDTNKDGSIDLLESKVEECYLQMNEMYPGTYGELIEGERKLKRKIIEENEAERKRNSPIKTDKKTFSQSFRSTPIKGTPRGTPTTLPRLK